MQEILQLRRNGHEWNEGKRCWFFFLIEPEKIEPLVITFTEKFYDIIQYIPDGVIELDLKCCGLQL